MIWQERTARDKQNAVRELVETQGLTYTQAALNLGTTRLAIAGVVERSLKGDQPIRSTSGQKNQKDRPGFKRGPRKSKNPRPRHAGHTAYIALPGPGPLRLDPVPSEAVWLAMPGSTPVPIADHTDGCRWPTGQERPFAFCNEPVKADGPYCARHATLAFRELPTAKRKETT